MYINLIPTIADYIVYFVNIQNLDVPYKFTVYLYLRELCREIGFIKMHIIFTDINNLKESSEFSLVRIQHFKMLAESSILFSKKM